MKDSKNNSFQKKSTAKQTKEIEKWMDDMMEEARKIWKAEKKK